MRNRNDQDLLFFILVVGLSLLTYKFSTWINVDWETGVEVIGKMFLVSLIWVGWKKLNPYHGYVLWPIAVAGLLWAWFPALDVWAYQESNFLPFEDYSYQQTEVKIAWFGQWYSKALILFTAIFGGYYIDDKVK